MVARFGSSFKQQTICEFDALSNYITISPFSDVDFTWLQMYIKNMENSALACN